MKFNDLVFLNSQLSNYSNAMWLKNYFSYTTKSEAYDSFQSSFYT